MLRDEAISFQETGVNTLLTVEMTEGCLRDTFDVAILFAADEDYVPLVEAVKRDGRRVVHAFLDVPDFGRRLRLACDYCRVVTEADLGQFVRTKRWSAWLRAECRYADAHRAAPTSASPCG